MFRRGVGVSKPTHEALLGRRGNVENSIYRPREERTLQKRPTREPSSMADFPMSSIRNHFESPKSWTFDSLLVPRFPTNHHQNPLHKGQPELAPDNNTLAPNKPSRDCRRAKNELFVFSRKALVLPVCVSFYLSLLSAFPPPHRSLRTYNG
jgi:hypothetical protein